jgi:uncharacterized membrane protein YdbT with pleckstrin-like domain
MASYLERTLAKDERVIAEAKISLARFWLSFVVGGFFILMSLLAAAGGASGGLGVAVVVGLIFILPPLIAYRTNQMVLTNRRIIAKSGMIATRAVEIKVGKVEGLTVNQGILGRIFDYGTVIFSGTGSTHAKFPVIAKPMAFRRAVEDALDQLTASEKAA